ncbi:5'-nucleotidase [uncultured Dokdonia sp.]|uniref:5'-nucleotidase C-terminal domain-containing protein n=1 Tax=uncultured Dokdonia sp. TaxID=575653 RepID=UPI002610D875|nr:5'-nucleotidase [uncultured Dokdonia sp.]
MVLKKITYLLLFVGIFTLFTCCKQDTYNTSRVDAKTVSIDRSIKEDSSITAFITPFKAAVDKEMDSVLAYAPTSISKNDTPYNTALGNMMADAVFEMANPVFKKRVGYTFNAVILNHGGIRAPLNKGKVTTGTAYELMPFENEVVVVELSGFQMKELFQYLAKGKAHPISNLQVILNEDGSLKQGTIQGHEIIDNETYFVATSDYLQKGGDNMTFLTKPVSLLTLDYKIRNVLIDYFKKYDTIAPVRDNRFIKE